MSTLAVANDLADYASAAQAIRKFPGLTRVRLYRMGVTQRIRVKLEPGIPPRYHLEDVAREISRELANESRGAQ
jgi:hypothetical protein